MFCALGKILYFYDEKDSICFSDVLLPHVDGIWTNDE